MEIINVSSLVHILPDLSASPASVPLFRSTWKTGRKVTTENAKACFLDEGYRLLVASFCLLYSFHKKGFFCRFVPPNFIGKLKSRETYTEQESVQKKKKKDRSHEGKGCHEILVTFTA